MVNKILQCKNSVVFASDAFSASRKRCAMQCFRLMTTIAHRHNQAKHCIAQRLREAENASDANTTLLLALENFVYQDSEGKFRDSCLVGVRMKSDGLERFFQEICHTPRREFSVIVPECLYPTLIEAENTGNTLQKTCGQMLREKFGEEIEFSDKDWFKAVANSEFDRKQQIVSELYNCRSLLHTAFYEEK